MHHIYCISGLGADHRIFQKLKIENAELHFIAWELPANNDTMRSYALKLAKQIKHDNIVLLGVSFGGMLATEINRYYQEIKKGVAEPQPLLNSSVVITKTILVSSCKTNNEFPGLMQLAGRIKFHKAVPYQLVLRNKALNRFMFDLRSNEEELYLKRLMLKQNNVALIKRSIHLILTWKAATPGSIVHIHGLSDRLLTPQKIKADYWIEDGGHFMVWNKADEVSAILNNV
jgi:pimeloyl-ACP methyl ester carboxylesterase